MILDLLKYTIIVTSVIVIPFSLYHFIIGLHSFKKSSNFRDTDKLNKFAILVAARNEEKVIGNLIDSLKDLDYPKDMYEIIISPNNCTDNTKDVALQKGVRVFEPIGTIKSKGQVLHQLFDLLIKNENHDAYVVFDADNLVDKNFLSEMNKVIESGYSAAQGFRDSKNPFESITSGCYTIFHYMINTFYNKPRTTLNINNMLIGCGFMTTRTVIEDLGGWNTKTLTEDLEFTVLTTLEGHRIGYSEKAIYYDEQPNSFIDSWHQRVRWSLGAKQGLFANLKNLINAFFNRKEIESFDKIAMLSASIISNVSLVATIAGCALIAMETTYRIGLKYFGLNILASIVGGSLFAIFVLVLTGKKIRPYWKGILGFGLFLFSWIPINLYVLFKKDMVWKVMKHESDIKFEELK